MTGDAGARRSSVSHVMEFARRLTDEVERGHRGRRDLPIWVPLSVAAGLVTCGNGIVLAGRGLGARELTTSVGMGVVSLIGLGVARTTGCQARDLGLRRPERLGPKWPLQLAGGAVVVGLAFAALRRETCDVAAPVAGVLGRMLLATAFGEELAFRGVLVATSLASPLSRSSAVALNVVAFGAWHIAGAFGARGFQPVEVLVPTAGAVLFLWARGRYGSVLAAALLHAAFNVPAWAITTCG